MRNELRGRLRLLAISAVSVATSALSLAVFVLWVAALALVIVWVGLPVIMFGTSCTRRLAGLYRRYAGGLLGDAIESPYLRIPDDGILVRVRTVLADPASRRDWRWLFVDGTLGMALGCAGVCEGLLDVLFWWLPPGKCVMTHARMSRALLVPSEKSRLAMRVQQLTESRRRRWTHRPPNCVASSATCTTALRHASSRSG